MKIVPQSSNSKAAICVVDLSLKEELVDGTSSTSQLVKIDDQIRENEEEEGPMMKNIPNTTSQKE